MCYTTVKRSGWKGCSLVSDESKKGARKRSMLLVKLLDLFFNVCGERFAQAVAGVGCRSHTFLEANLCWVWSW